MWEGSKRSEEFLQVKLPSKKHIVPNHMNVCGSFGNEVAVGNTTWELWE